MSSRAVTLLYLVSLLPSRIVADLGAPVPGWRGHFTLCLPPATAGRSGLLIGPHRRTTRSASRRWRRAGCGFAAFYRRCRLVTTWPTLIDRCARGKARRDIVNTAATGGRCLASHGRRADRACHRRRGGQ